MLEVRDPAWLKHLEVSHIIWDVDGTITEGDRLHTGVLNQIVQTSRSGVFHTFITGRDAEWLRVNLINCLEEIIGDDIARQMQFFAEVGSIATVFGGLPREMHMEINTLLQDHPLIANFNGIRDKLRALVWNPDNLLPWPSVIDVPPSFYDANGNAFTAISKPPLFPQYIWSPFKQAIATFEKVRNFERKVMVFDQSPCEQAILDVVREAGIQDSVAVELVSTAINIVPVVNNVRIGKGWAAGQALEALLPAGRNFFKTRRDAVEHTIAIGDGLSDLDFGSPLFSGDGPSKFLTLPVVFVGDKSELEQLKSDKVNQSKLSRIVISGKGNHRGPAVTEAVMNFLQNYGTISPHEGGM